MWGCVGLCPSLHIMFDKNAIIFFSWLLIGIMYLTCTLLFPLLRYAYPIIVYFDSLFYNPYHSTTAIIVPTLKTKTMTNGKMRIICAILNPDDDTIIRNINQPYTIISMNNNAHTQTHKQHTNHRYSMLPNTPYCRESIPPFPENEW